jgi:hypothetical protein
MGPLTTGVGTTAAAGAIQAISNNPVMQATVRARAINPGAPGRQFIDVSVYSN